MIRLLQAGSTAGRQLPQLCGGRPMYLSAPQLASQRARLLLLLPLLLPLLSPPAAATDQTFSNVKPRLDSATGKILELGDGSIAKFGSRYYLYGVKYVCTPSPRTPLGYGCPRRDRRIWGNMSIGIASSADMVSWRLETYDAIPEMHEAATVYPAADKAWFMPTIVHNPRTNRFALWYYIDGFARGVAVADSPVGPFKIVHHCIPNLGLGSSFFFWAGTPSPPPSHAQNIQTVCF